MTVTQKMIEAIGHKEIIWLWPVKTIEEIQAIVNAEDKEDAVFKTISLRSLARILFAFQQKMDTSEKAVFETICSYFSGPGADSKWLTNEDPEITYLVLECQPFIDLMQNSWAHYKLINKLPDSQWEEGDAVTFLQDKRTTCKSVLLELVWGR